MVLCLNKEAALLKKRIKEKRINVLTWEHQGPEVLLASSITQLRGNTTQLLRPA